MIKETACAQRCCCPGRLQICWSHNPRHDCVWFFHGYMHVILIWVSETGLKEKDADESETDSSSDSSSESELPESVGTLDLNN